MQIRNLLKRKTDESENRVFWIWFLACILKVSANITSPESSLGLSHHFLWLCILLDLNFYLKMLFWKSYFFQHHQKCQQYWDFLKMHYSEIADATVYHLQCPNLHNWKQSCACLGMTNVLLNILIIYRFLPKALCNCMFYCAFHY